MVGVRVPVRLIETKRFADERGWFMETWAAERTRALGIDCDWVQDNQSLSRQPGTIRGIHFQAPPFAQAKLVRCVAGKIMDYAVDLRRGSPTYGHHVAAELSADNGLQLYVPVGFGHAFLTLEPDTQVAYKVSAPYDRDSDGGVRWDDPAIGIDWPLPPGGAILSDKDRALPTLAEFDSPFAFDGAPLGPL